MSHSERGSLWNRWDLHFHTPSSYDYADKGISNKQIVDRLLAEGVRAIAITDHHVMDIARIKEISDLAGDRLLVLPGIELRSDHGGDPVHYICIFPEDCDIEHVWTTLQGSLGLTSAALKAAGGDDNVYVPIENGAEKARELGGVVSIHAGAKSNSIESIKNKEQFQQRIKLNITSKWVDLMEIGQIKDIDAHLNTIFPAIGFDRPLIICSDNHNINEYSIKAPLWFRADPTFRGLLMTLREPRDRVFIGTRPTELIRVEQNPTKHIRGISFNRLGHAPSAELWFSGSVPFNPGLVAIVGNKGSGKSAIADMLGLLGSTKNSSSFSFLSDKRFRHPTNGFADYFEATIEWHSGEKITRSLADVIKAEEIERLKYLPQDHVEKVCNELVGVGEEGFEKELKAVIFSHVPEAQRLGHASLDALVRFQTNEKQKRIDSLIKQLRDASRLRANLESQADPTNKGEILEKIKRRTLEIDAHKQTKPAEKKDPALTPGSAADSAQLQELAAAESSKKSLTVEINAASAILASEERRQAVAKLLNEKLLNFEKDYEVFKSSLSQEALELKLAADELVTVKVNRSSVEKIQQEAEQKILDVSKNLDEVDPPGLRHQLVNVEAIITELHSKLDAPNREYQVYLNELAEWEEKEKKLEGSDEDPESLKGLQSSYKALDELPQKIKDSQSDQLKLAVEIHGEKIAQAAIYRNLYGPVQQFIDLHELAKNKLKLEFKAELTNEDFISRLVNFLAMNRRGSFYGVDEGRAKLEAFVQVTKWDDPGSVRKFLESVDNALHNDIREKPSAPTQLKDQLLKGKKAEEVFDMLYGMEYIRPKYILRWEGKDISMLSPGERGTLLLVFYLLIDKGDMPLIIDQPEGNLDNHTVAKVLVDCIKAARKKRQVFIVTHNPNLAVVCDADQVIHASMDKISGNAISYKAGALENPITSQHVTDVLEGTRWAFDVRGKKYDVGKQA